MIKIKLVKKTSFITTFLFALLGFSSSLYANNTWSLVGNLNTPRAYHSATTFNGTQVLVAGGNSASVLLNSAEIFNQGTSLWQSTSSMNQARQQHAAVLLDDGRILIAGGSGESSDLASVEIYDPTTTNWTLTSAMSSPRVSALITKLQDGRVLVSGGTTDGVNVTTAEIYDPATNSWTSTGAMVADTAHTNAAVLLNDGRVFIRGHAGYTNGSAVDIQPGDPYYPAESPTKLPQMFDPASNTWSAVSPMNRPKLGGTSILLSDGSVLAVGGERFGGASWGYPIFYCDLPAEIYNPTTDTWTVTNGLNSPGLNPSKVSLLPDGNVLAFGPSITYNVYSACGTDGGKTDLFDTPTGTWAATDIASTRHDNGGAFAALGDGSVLTIGAGTFQEVVEIYTASGTPPEPPARSEFLHVADIDGQGVENNNYPYFTWAATTTFTIKDEDGQPVEGATVSSIYYSSQINPDVCTTDSAGQCNVQITESNSDHSVTVTNITKSLMTYDAAANSDPDGDSDGTTIVIQRPGAPEPWMYVSDIDGSSEKQRRRRWEATVSIQITNWNGDPENFVEVFGVWSGGASGTASCLPSSNGTCEVTSGRLSKSTSSATFTVTDVTSNWFIYDPSLNTDPDGDSNGTSITVNKP
ncbi:MAG: kelch repeat-containing protein [Porticoccus sp.]|nr:kelch repeat-containing protein [Porticoccus sp.]